MQILQLELYRLQLHKSMTVSDQTSWFNSSSPQNPTYMYLPQLSPKPCQFAPALPKSLPICPSSPQNPAHLPQLSLKPYPFTQHLSKTLPICPSSRPVAANLTSVLHLDDFYFCQRPIIDACTCTCIIMSQCLGCALASSCAEPWRLMCVA